VLDLHVPDVQHGLLAVLAREWPFYAAYVVSFGTTGIIWLNHHAFFDRLRRVDRPLLVLNLLLLMSVSLLPFPTGVIARYLEHPDGAAAAAVYCANMAVMGLLFGALALYAARRPGLLTADAARAIDGRWLARFGVGGPLYAAAAGLALLDARISLVVCAVLAAYYAVLPAPGRTRHEE